MTIPADRRVEDGCIWLSSEVLCPKTDELRAAMDGWMDALIVDLTDKRSFGELIKREPKENRLRAEQIM
ncbi:hypothetical protein MSG28_009878 [Choristoneura fumiferana]|uniref:Uncharacterized protein n=1 Tax=Choristoneura fumiferana TaxID=7141 RepID=A0ACC0JCY0_CHOFU|nr:hypothetical protein MSG28_009878 [Choristoneura fumiferana]